MRQQELADASGLDIRYIGSIERGQRNPTFGVLQARYSVGVWDENIGFAAKGEAVMIGSFYLNPAHSTVEKEADEAVNSVF